jgi:DNA-binding XRE family transcriptional regulator
MLEHLDSKPMRPIKPYRAPDPEQYNPAPDYIRYVIRQKGLTISEACRRIGLNRNTMNDKLNPKLATSVSYAEQYILENL